MSRIRSIHPGLWTDEAFVSLPPMARLLLMGIWNECDDMGSFEWSPLKLKMRLLPADNVDASELLEAISNVNCITKYEVSGKTYGAVRNFCQFQRPKKANSTYPQTAEIRDYVNINAREARTGGEAVGNELPTGGEKPRQMEDGGDKGRKNTPLPPAGGDPTLPERVVSEWNSAIAGSPLPKALSLNSARLKHLKARISEHGEDAVFQAIRNMCASDFHSGRDGKWTEGNLGWLLKSPENFQKMLERQAPERKPVVIDHSVYDRLKAKGYDTAASTASGGDRRSESTGPPRPISQLIPKFGSM